MYLSTAEAPLPVAWGSIGARLYATCNYALFLVIKMQIFYDISREWNMAPVIISFSIPIFFFGEPTTKVSRCVWRFKTTWVLSQYLKVLFPSGFASIFVHKQDTSYRRTPPTGKKTRNRKFTPNFLVPCQVKNAAALIRTRFCFVQQLRSGSSINCNANDKPQLACGIISFKGQSFRSELKLVHPRTHVPVSNRPLSQSVQWINRNKTRNKVKAQERQYGIHVAKKQDSCMICSIVL